MIKGGEQNDLIPMVVEVTCSHEAVSPVSSGSSDVYWIWVEPLFSAKLASKTRLCSPPWLWIQHRCVTVTCRRQWLITSTHAFAWPPFLIAERQADPVHHDAAGAEWQQEPFSESCHLESPRGLCAFSLSQTGQWAHIALPCHFIVILLLFVMI